MSHSKKTLSIFNCFARFSQGIAAFSGSAPAFIVAMLLVVLWALLGPVFKFSETWQLVINTTTSIATFLMVFLIQASQNREMKAIQLKLDEILLSQDKASNLLIDLETCTDEEIESVHQRLMACRTERRNSSTSKVDKD